jgi:hypothetical protein
MSARAAAPVVPAAPPPGLHAACIIGAIALVAAAAWTFSRICLGLDFTDEMQYYGEISALTRTGKFFQSDLFLQQLGYIFVLPFFKLHALVFSDQRYLVLFGRLLLAGGYLAVGGLVWRAMPRLGEFSIAQRLVALATFIAWVPFQIFAPSYNSMAYLLIVAVLAVALPPEAALTRRSTFRIGAFVTALTFVYPPAGLVLILLTVLGAARSGGARHAWRLLITIAGGGVLVLVIMIAVHGTAFPRDLLAAFQFSRAFGVAEEIRQPEQIASLLAIALTTGIFLRRLIRPTGRGPNNDRGVRGLPGSARYIVITVLAVAGVGGWLLGVYSRGGFIWTALFALSLALLTLWLGRADETVSRGPRRIAIAALFASGGALFLLSVRWTPSAYFAATIFLLFLVLLLPNAEPGERRTLRELAFVGTLMGMVFAVTSGNGLHNFGVGAAPVLPFLVLYSARALSRTGGRFATITGPAGMAAVVLFIVGNAALSPYREDRDWTRFQLIRDVPAFAGIATSAPKIEAMRLVRALVGPNRLAGKRVLVAGPHPWIYFVAQAQPDTPMLFMHFDGPTKVYDFLAARLFEHGSPDAIFVTNTLPPPIQAKILEWGRQGCTGQVIQMRDELRTSYQWQVPYEIAREIVLMRRAPSTP